MSQLLTNSNKPKHEVARNNLLILYIFNVFSVTQRTFNYTLNNKHDFINTVKKCWSFLGQIFWGILRQIKTSGVRLRTPSSYATVRYAACFCAKRFNNDWTKRFKFLVLNFLILYFFTSLSRSPIPFARHPDLAFLLLTTPISHSFCSPPRSRIPCLWIVLQTSIAGERNTVVMDCTMSNVLNRTVDGSGVAFRTTPTGKLPFCLFVSNVA